MAPNAAYPGIFMAAYNPSLPFSVGDFERGCGDPAYYYLIMPLITTSITISIRATAFLLNDNINSLASSRQGCDANTSKYMYYQLQYDLNGLGDSLAGSTCDVGEAGAGDASTPCPFHMHLGLQTSAVTSQMSKHGTDFKTIFTDEGGILGGLLFMTWFLGIFVV
jgi:hypothetical protein